MRYGDALCTRKVTANLTSALQVRTYASSSKFLIFSRSGLTLLYIAEGLALLNVPYKLTTCRPVKAMEQDVTTFESSDTFRVFLMELKHGARGL